MFQTRQVQRGFLYSPDAEWLAAGAAFAPLVLCIEDGYPPALCFRALIGQFWKMPKLGPVQTAHHPLAMGEGRWLAILFALYVDTNPHGIKKPKRGPKFLIEIYWQGDPLAFKKGGNG